MKDEKTLEEIKEDLMRWPNAVSKQLDSHTKTLCAMIHYQEQILELICKLHKIDLDEIRAEFAIGDKI